MRKILIFVIITAYLNAHWLKDIPQIIKQSSGQTIQCFATGDQYAHRLHDKDDYTIVLNPVDGDFYYAEKLGEKIQPSQRFINFPTYWNVRGIIMRIFVFAYSSIVSGTT